MSRVKTIIILSLKEQNFCVIMCVVSHMIVREKQVKNIFTKSDLPVGDFSVNPYVGCSHACMYCYACYMKRFTRHEEPWGEFVDVKYWPTIRNASKYEGKHIVLGSVTDPYQPLEKKYERTRSFLEQMQDSGIGLTIITKSDLILRDMDLIKKYDKVELAWSINTVKDSFQREMDRAVSIDRRFAAMREFHSRGIPTVCFAAPIFPGTDVKQIIDAALGCCDRIWLENLNLRGSYRYAIMDYIKAKHPRLYPLYKEIYDYGDKTYWRALDLELREYCQSIGLQYVNSGEVVSTDSKALTVINFFYHEKIKRSAKEGTDLQ